jgi:hypothetical protein
MATELENMSKDELLSRTLAEPKQKGINHVGIPNGLYTCFIEKLSIPKRREDWVKNEIKDKQEKLLEEYQTPECKWTDEELQDKLNFAEKSVATLEFKWDCLIIDDKPGKDTESKKKTNVRGQKIYPTANYVSTKSEQSKIVKLIKYLEGDDFEINNFKVTETWVGKYTQLKVVNSAGGYPKATFEGQFLKGDELEFAQKKHEDTKTYIAKMMASESKEEEPSSSPSSNNHAQDYKITKVNQIIANNIIDSIYLKWEREQSPTGIDDIVREYPNYTIQAIRKTVEALCEQGALVKQKDNKFLLVELS